MRKYRLTERDILVILDVYKYRYLTITQINSLHFQSRRTTYRRLQALRQLGYLKSFIAPNIPERIFYLDKPGAEIVATELQLPVEALQWNRYTKVPKDYYFLKHFLGINDFRIHLTLACHNSPITLLGFIPEYFGEKTVKGYVQKYIRDRVCDISSQTIFHSHTPDAVFALEKEGNAALFFLEIDRGFEAINDTEKGFLKSILFYLNYWKGDQWKRYEKEFTGKTFKTFRALIVTTSQERLQNMRQAVTKLAFPTPQAKRFIWGATDIRGERMFTPIWQAMDTADERAYKIG